MPILSRDFAVSMGGSTATVLTTINCESYYAIRQTQRVMTQAIEIRRCVFNAIRPGIVKKTDYDNLKLILTNIVHLDLPRPIHAP